jgi:hypothetical protein
VGVRGVLDELLCILLVLECLDTLVALCYRSLCLGLIFWNEVVVPLEAELDFINRWVTLFARATCDCCHDILLGNHVGDDTYAGSSLPLAVKGLTDLPWDY